MFRIRLVEKPEKKEEDEEKQRQLHSILRLTQAQKSAIGFARKT